MAFRREALLELGGFDPYSGAGTPARGAEDLDICIRLIFSGQTLVYEPRAIVRHRHLDTMRLLYRKVFSYGIGLGALIAKYLTSGPNRSRLLGLIPAAIRYLVSPSHARMPQGDRFPRRLDVIEWIGLVSVRLPSAQQVAGRERDATPSGTESGGAIGRTPMPHRHARFGAGSSSCQARHRDRAPAHSFRRRV